LEINKAKAYEANITILLKPLVLEMEPKKEIRTGTGTKVVFGLFQMRFDLADGLSHCVNHKKKLHLKNPICHDYLVFIKGDTNITYSTRKTV